MEARPWMISVLSTSYDLKEYRSDVIELLKNKQFAVSAYEEPEFPVETDMHSHESCLVALNRADIAIVIIDKRSGGTYYDIDKGEEKISITEAECLEAIRQEMPIFFFVSKEAYNELHAYKEGYKSFCTKNKYTSKATTKIRKYHNEYDKSYVCTHVEKIQTLKFIDTIQNAYKEFGISNWMYFYENRKDLLTAVEGKLTGYSRKLLHRLARSQRDGLLDIHTSTALGMSLGDVFDSEYYIEPPHKIESGRINATSSNGLLSDEIKEVLNTDSSILVYGEAGYGKTTILAKCFDEHVKCLDKNISYDIPLFLPLKNKGSDYHFDIERYIEEELMNAKDTKLRHAKYPCMDLRSIRIHFYCDGFDEIAETLSADDLDRIKDSSIFRYPLVLTCRQQYTLRYLNEFNFADKFGVRIQMEKWSVDIARNYIANFCDKKGKSKQQRNKIFAAIDENDDLQQVLDSPLLITMFLWFIERQQSRVEDGDISRAKIFENWMDALSKRELSKHAIAGMSSQHVIDIWEVSAWQVYWHRVHNRKLHMDDLMVRLNETFSEINGRDITAWFDALFDCMNGYVNGTFHEQFMEFLVARFLIRACINKSDPYPDFLKLVLRPEINRYFREIWGEKSEQVKQCIYEALMKQYFDNAGKDDNESVAIRVHAIYFLCRLDSPMREECIERAFRIEKQIPVLLSLYFGAIKLGKKDKEIEFYEHLIKEQEYSNANRGYHLVYYADSNNMVLPYGDNNQCDWKGTLDAFERHFESKELGHYYLRRIDIVTMIHLIQARKDALPLTEEKLGYFGQKIAESPYAKMSEHGLYNQGVLDAYESLKEVFEEHRK